MHQARLHRSEFTKRLLVEFPELRAEMRGNRTGIHLELSVFRVFTQDAIDRKDRKLVHRAFRFVAECIPQAEENVHAAIGSSYLEDLDFSGEARRWALTEMPSVVRQTWVDVNVYMEELLGETRIDRGFDREKELARGFQSRSG